MKERSLVSTLTLIGSLASYYYAKTHEKDVVPYVMIGGFVGAWLGEMIAKVSDSKQNDKDEKN
ncbi:MAG: hypothetical protein ACJ77K_08125 [Bacteroidia bacterium]|jgi:uncharacterized membrane protein YfcA